MSNWSSRKYGESRKEDEDYEKYANNEEYDTNNSEYIEFSIRGDKYSE